jgi:hypothetical protein
MMGGLIKPRFFERESGAFYGNKQSSVEKRLNKIKGLKVGKN